MLAIPKFFMHLFFVIIIIGAPALFWAANLIFVRDIPVIAIARHGKDIPSDKMLMGMKNAIKNSGLEEGKDFVYKLEDVDFVPTLIPKMFSTLKEYDPVVTVAMGTPVAQFAKNVIINTPIVFSAIVDPVSMGLLKKYDEPYNNVTGVSDNHDIEECVELISSLIPDAKKVGYLYHKSDNNDLLLYPRLKKSLEEKNITMIDIGLNEGSDMSMSVASFVNDIDAIYVANSGEIMRSLSSLSVISDRFKIPTFSSVIDMVDQNYVFAAIGADYNTIGKNTGELVAQLLQGKDISTVKPRYISKEEHLYTVNRKKLEILNLEITTYWRDKGLRVKDGW